MPSQRNSFQLLLHAKIPFLIDRAEMLRKARAFFAERNILEVDCPALSPSASIAQHIEVMKVLSDKDRISYLHTSPEYGMKRLIASGIGDIYQISHVFRAEEIGPLHNPEFTLTEWYRVGICFEEMIAETLAFIRLFLGDLPHQVMSYRQLFQHYLDINYCSAPLSELVHCAISRGHALPKDVSQWDRDTLLQLLLTFLIEPQLGKQELFVLSSFPASQAALSRTVSLPEGEQIALRFEVYYRGIELANGYHELTDAVEQRRRFDEDNQARRQAGKEALKIDERFIQALEYGLPDCCGVAVGFDRLMMLKHQQSTLENILPMIWEES